MRETLTYFYLSFVLNLFEELQPTKFSLLTKKLIKKQHSKHNIFLSNSVYKRKSFIDMSQQQLQNKIHFLSQAPFSFLFDVHVSQLPIKIRYGYL